MREKLPGYDAWKLAAPEDCEPDDLDAKEAAAIERAEREADDCPERF